MTRALKLNMAGKTAIIAALLSGSSLAYAQDAAPVVAEPAPAAPVAAPVAEATVAPPPAVSTLPTSNDVVNPVAAQEAAAEEASKRQVTAAPRASVRPRVVSTAPVITAAPESSISAQSEVTPPAVDAIDPAVTTVEETAAIAPVEQPVAEESGVSSEDMTLFGGLAAALAAIGLGAAFASRRRRRVVADERVAVVAAAPEYAAPRPISEDPAFQQFASAPVHTPVAERTVQRTPVMTRPDVPITDPLFSRKVVAAPITDPLFAPRNDVQPPITDPLFAKHDRFAGRAPATPAVIRERELVN